MNTNYHYHIIIITYYTLYLNIYIYTKTRTHVDGDISVVVDSFLLPWRRCVLVEGSVLPPPGDAVELVVLQVQTAL